MFGINWSPNWIEWMKNLGYVAGAVTVYNQYAPMVSGALPVTTPVLHAVGIAVAGVGMVAHFISDQIVAAGVQSQGPK